MTITTDAQIRERPLEDVKKEIVRRAGTRNPLEGVKPEDAAAVAEGGHMGRGGGVTDEEIWTMIIQWLKLRL